MDELPEIVINWNRPTSIPFPKIWQEFEIRKQDGSLVKIKIQDIPPDRFQDVVEFMSTNYLRDELLSKSAKILNDKVSVAVYQYVFAKALEEKMSLVAFVDDPNSSKPIIAGVHILTVYSKSDPPLPEVPGEVMKKMIDIYYAIRKDLNIFELLQTNEYLHDWGICVAPEYRGLGLCYQILATLPKLCAAMNVKATMILFTSKYAQSCAYKLNYKVYNEIVYKDYKNVAGDPIFPITEAKSAKLMGIVF